MAGWWLTNPPEKYESQIGSSSQLLGKIKNVWNHQPLMAFLPLSYYKFHQDEIWLLASEQTFSDTPLESPWLLLYISHHMKIMKSCWLQDQPFFCG